MTFRKMQDTVMDSLNLTSAESRLRIKTFLNQRYREVQTGCNLARTRHGTVNFVTTSGVPTVTASGIAKLHTLYDPTTRRRVLDETTETQILLQDPASTQVQAPYQYAVTAHANDTITLRLFPVPDATYTLPATCLIAGTEMTEDDDEPSFPVDFHDVLVKGARADELRRMEKLQPLASAEETRYEKRLAELRYFLVKSNFLRRQATDHMVVAPMQRVTSSPATIV